MIKKQKMIGMGVSKLVALKLRFCEKYSQSKMYFSIKKNSFTVMFLVLIHLSLMKFNCKSFQTG